jgi:hypothetical protein
MIPLSPAERPGHRITTRHRYKYILHKPGRDESARCRAPEENADRAVSPLSGQYEAFG